MVCPSPIDFFDTHLPLRLSRSSPKAPTVEMRVKTDMKTMLAKNFFISGYLLNCFICGKLLVSPFESQEDWKGFLKAVRFI
jgi:hypothetical protein